MLHVTEICDGLARVFLSPTARSAHPVFSSLLSFSDVLPSLSHAKDAWVSRSLSDVPALSCKDIKSFLFLQFLVSFLLIFGVLALVHLLLGVEAYFQSRATWMSLARQDKAALLLFW